MRPLNSQDYLLLTIVIVTAIAGICAMLVALHKVLEEARERRTQPNQPASVPRRSVRSGYRVSIVRH